MAVKVFNSWRELMTDLKDMNEEDLRESINFEVSTYKRKAFISRMHMRFERLRSTREREELLRGETLL